MAILGRALAAVGVLGLLVTSIAVLRQGPVERALRVGDRFPVLKGQFLIGRDAVLPHAASGKVAFVAMGFTYESRLPVEAWADWYQTMIGTGSGVGVTLFEVPMIGGLATLGRWFIDRGMREGTPREVHEQVITAYRGTEAWMQRLSCSPNQKNDAYLVVLDRDGVVRWSYRGGFDSSRSNELEDILTARADRRAGEGDPAPSKPQVD